MQKKTSCLLSLILILFTAFTITSCSKKIPAEKPVLKINDYSVSLEEFDKRFSELKNIDNKPETKKAFLDNFINRKVLLLEAQRLEIDKEPAFLDAVEKFWEQSLLKLIVDRKLKEIAQSIKVSKSEVEAAANKWLAENPSTTKPKEEIIKLIMKQRVREKQTLALNSWIADLRAAAQITIDNDLLGLDNMSAEENEAAEPVK